MLKPEQAQARLAEWRLPEEEGRLKQEVARLPAALREIATTIFELREDDKLQDDWQEKENRRCQAVMELDEQSPANRAKVFTAIAPQLSRHMEQAWQLINGVPYQSGYLRKAFRAPNHPQLAMPNIGHWLWDVATLGTRFQAEVLTPVWIASWAAHLDENYRSYGPHLGAILAAVLNENDSLADQVFEILRQSLLNEHEIGGPGRHVYTAFLLSNRSAGWELMERTLLAAQRQEGLRQAILETIDFSHPQAFRRMLRIILEHDLFRFSSVIRAVDVWFGQLWEPASTPVVKRMLGQLVQFLEDAALRRKALQGNDAEAAFLALWCEAIEDAVESVPLAEKLLQAKSPELRYIAIRHLVNLNIHPANVALAPALDDEDLRVAQLALSGNPIDESPQQNHDGPFERIERLLPRIPLAPLKLKPIVWPWTESAISRSQAAGSLISCLGKRPATRLIPYLSLFQPPERRGAVKMLVEPNPWDPATREVILKLTGDAVVGVRETCLMALEQRGVLPGEIPILESYLTRTVSDLRRGVLVLLLKQDDDAAVASCRRLLDSNNASQRLAGLELLRLLCDAQRSTSQCRELAAAYTAKRKKLGKEEQSHLDEIAREKVKVASLDDALGLMNPADRTPPTPPRDLPVQLVTTATIACLRSLDDLVHDHREVTIEIKNYNGDTSQELLGTLDWGFPTPEYEKPSDGQQERLPLNDVWLKWSTNRGDNLRDADGLELLRASIWGEEGADYLTRLRKKSSLREQVEQTFAGGKCPPKLRYQRVVLAVLDWLLFLSPPDGIEYLLDAMEKTYALLPADEMAKLTLPRKESRTFQYAMADDSDWRFAGTYEMWSEALDEHLKRTVQTLTPPQIVRLWQLMHWRDQPIEGARRSRVEVSLLMQAYTCNAATLADVADHLLGARGDTSYGGTESFNLLSKLTDRKRSKWDDAWLNQHPEIQNLLQQAVERILELELNRGDSPTAATAPARNINCILGIDTLRRILQALGKHEFKLANSWREDTREERRCSLTALTQVTFPAQDDTPEVFKRVMKAAIAAAEFPPERLLQLVFLSPQWTKHVEAYLGWPQMSEGVYWFLAHMRYVWGVADNAAEAGNMDPAATGPTGEEKDGDDDAQCDRMKKLSPWQRLILERTPLTEADRDEGAIDVNWFRRTHDLLGDKRWQALAAAARFAANASQARHAQFIADVLLNKVKRQELITGIEKKQLKDHVRLLGLLPLATGKKREADLAERCQVLAKYRRYANSLSGLTKPSALRAWEIGMRNLAQMAGYGDPLRLEWAVGADALSDLTKGPLTAAKDGVTVTLRLDELATPEITAQKGEKLLKSIPPTVKKVKRVAALTGRVADLKKQATAIRQSLETAMCRGDQFTGDELRRWFGHALLAPLLARLIVVGESMIGYPDKGGRALRDFHGKFTSVKPTQQFRLAHPHDLLQSGDWHDWQRECFQAERIQPFKQVFRELYLVTRQEQKDGSVSHRYDGHQVQPKQAAALFGARGWDTRDGVFKVFHDAALTAVVQFQSGVTMPLEVEGWTLAGVSFLPRDQWRPTKLKLVPPRLFSEVMRDLDLVVSVAHAGGVDPEASASTVEMRSGLVRETCSLLNLKNVRLKPSHAVIDGEIANYTVHLGSGVVHKMPGGSLCIVPVHSQHRGRLFLPFADNDPVTAEVMSKILLLARDREIQDPTILEQIRC